MEDAEYGHEEEEVNQQGEGGDGYVEHITASGIEVWPLSRSSGAEGPGRRPTIRSPASTVNSPVLVSNNERESQQALPSSSSSTTGPAVRVSVNLGPSRHTGSSSPSSSYLSGNAGLGHGGEGRSYAPRIPTISPATPSSYAPLPRTMRMYSNLPSSSASTNSFMEMNIEGNSYLRDLIDRRRANLSPPVNPTSSGSTSVTSRSVSTSIDDPPLSSSISPHIRNPSAPGSLSHLLESPPGPSSSSNSRFPPASNPIGGNGGSPTRMIFPKTFEKPSYLSYSAFRDQLFTFPPPIASSPEDTFPSFQLLPSSSNAPNPQSTSTTRDNRHASKSSPLSPRHTSSFTSTLDILTSASSTLSFTPSPSLVEKSPTTAAPGTLARGGTHGYSEDVLMRTGNGNWPIGLPTCWDPDDKWPFVDVGSDGLSVTFAGIGKNSTGSDAASVRANRKIPPQAGIYYYEVSIVSKGQSGFIGIGFSALNVPLNRLPGAEKDSWGYHGDDGHSFECGEGKGTKYGPRFTTGDVIGCGVDWGRRQAFYTKNGKFLGYVFSNLKDQLYPSVGLKTAGEVVKANFGQEPFAFDIDTFVRERQAAVVSEIRHTVPAIPRPPSPPIVSSSTTEERKEGLTRTTRDLVISYLLHQGYIDTAKALERQVSQEERDFAAATRRHQLRRDSSLDGDVDIAPGSATASTGTARGPHPFDVSAQIDREDIIRRQQIYQAVLSGDSDFYITQVQKHYPGVLLDEETNMLFKLRLRKFVELVLKADEESQTVQSLSSAEGQVEEKLTGADEGTEHRDADGDSPMRGVGPAGSGESESEAEPDVDLPPVPSLKKQGKRRLVDGSPTLETPTSSSSRSRSPSPSPSPVALSCFDAALRYGRSLQEDYGSDSRPSVQEALKQVYSLLAYDRLDELDGELGKLVEEASRRNLAEELNSAILISQGRSPRPPLETLYRQTVVLTLLAGWMSLGGAALVDIRDLLFSP